MKREEREVQIVWAGADLERTISTLPIVRRDMRGTWFTEKEVGKREMTDGNDEEVSPHLVIRLFDV